ncbi:rCG22407 [Rattus norvegicus]|uniref:RCG22407 n=1 Tax=Rattus norvegicus TaxID=10116 RepID=A6INU9_RAT|nr:rCG22407 [Rattus norvegicus]
MINSKQSTEFGPCKAVKSKWERTCICIHEGLTQH